LDFDAEKVLAASLVTDIESETRLSSDALLLNDVVRPFDLPMPTEIAFELLFEVLFVSVLLCELLNVFDQFDSSLEVLD
jgi:hypothetical protein